MHSLERDNRMQSKMIASFQNLVQDIAMCDGALKVGGMTYEVFSIITPVTHALF